MIFLTREQIAALKPWFLPEPLGWLVGSHVVHAGCGSCLADRWPAPNTILAEIAGNYTLVGEARALSATDLRRHVRGLVKTPENFIPLIEEAFPHARVWQRLVFMQSEAPPRERSQNYHIRRLEASDFYQLLNLAPEIAWISATWYGAWGLAASGFGWGAFIEGRLASVASTFFLGETYEEIGVVTQPEFRGLGLSTACARALCADVRARGHRPIWTTSPDNVASVRVAEKLGFVRRGRDRLYVIGVPIPQ